MLSKTPEQIGSTKAEIRNSEFTTVEEALRLFYDGLGIPFDENLFEDYILLYYLHAGIKARGFRAEIKAIIDDSEIYETEKRLIAKMNSTTTGRKLLEKFKGHVPVPMAFFNSEGKVHEFLLLPSSNQKIEEARQVVILAMGIAGYL